MLAFLDDWRLAKKLLVAFGFLGALVGGLAVTALLSNRTLTGIAQTHVEQGVASMSSLADVMSDVKELRIIVYSYHNAKTPKDEASLRGRLADGQKQLEDDIDALSKVVNGKMQGEVAELRNKAQALAEVNKRVFAMHDTGNHDATLDLLKGDAKDHSRAAIDQTKKLLEMSRAESQAANDEGMASSTFAMVVSVLLSLLTVLGLGAVWMVINRTVAGPMSKLTSATTTLAQGGKAEVPHRGRADELGQMAEAVEQFRAAAISRAEADARAAAEQQVVTSALRDGLSSLTRGDLTADIKADFPPAYGELKVNYNEALAALRELIGSVMESAATIQTGSHEIAQASEDLARRTEGNAASLEETSAAIAQMDERFRGTAEAAGRTVQRADGAIATVSGGRAVANDAVQAMHRVAESAKGIDSVIEGLDKIAFQTRVLAMNAAVEAGRAGDAGRGFAVVADLVSALAMRSEEEARSAREQLTVTQEEIVTAVTMVQKVDGALADISGDVGEVHGLLGQMAADNQAQSAAVTQITTAVNTMDQSTQQNAAMVEETSAAARNLTGEVTALAEQASRFSIGKAAPFARQQPIVVASAPAFKPKGYDRAKPAAAKAAPAPMLAGGLGTHADDWTAF